MITKMKKLLFLAYHKDYQNFLDSLRQLGVVHIVEKQQGVLDDTQLQNDVRLLKRLAAVLKLLENQKIGKTTVVSNGDGVAERGLSVLEQIDALQNDKGKLSQLLQGYNKDKVALQIWGDFDPAGIERLKEAGHVISFYMCSESAYRTEWETAYNAIKINTISSKVYFVTVTDSSQDVDIEAEPIKLPSYSLTKLNELYNQTAQAISDNQEKLEQFAANDIPSIKAAMGKLQGEIEFSTVVLSTEQAAGEKLMILGGGIHS